MPHHFSIMFPTCCASYIDVSLASCSICVALPTPHQRPSAVWLSPVPPAACPGCPCVCDPPCDRGGVGAGAQEACPAPADTTPSSQSRQTCSAWRQTCCGSCRASTPAVCGPSVSRSLCLSESVVRSELICDGETVVFFLLNVTMQFAIGILSVLCAILFECIQSALKYIHLSRPLQHAHTFLKILVKF